MVNVASLPISSNLLTALSHVFTNCFQLSVLKLFFSLLCTRKMKLIVGIVFLLSCHSAISAQRICGTEITNTAGIANSANTTKAINEYSRDTVPDEVINIPVIVHVLYKSAAQNISDEQILSQIAALNLDYRFKNLNAVNIPEAFKGLAADTRINFCLAQVDPTGHTTKGILLFVPA